MLAALQRQGKKREKHKFSADRPEIESSSEEAEGNSPKILASLNRDETSGQLPQLCSRRVASAISLEGHVSKSSLRSNNLPLNGLASLIATLQELIRRHSTHYAVSVPYRQALRSRGSQG